MTNYIMLRMAYIYRYVKRKKMVFVERMLYSYYVFKIKNIGKNIRFNGNSFFSGFDNIVIGNNVHIGNNAFIRGEGGLKIGDNTHISRNLVVYTMNHQYEGECLPYDSTLRYRPVLIEKNVWIGMNVVILPGSKIGEGAIIGAGAVVCGEVEPLAIYGATIAVKIGERDQDHYMKLEKLKKYGGVSGEIIK